MPSAATVRPFWAATLRDLTRLALTALVLALGAGAVVTAATGSTVAAPTRPGVVVSRVAELSPSSRPTAEQAAAQRAAEAPAERPTPVRPADLAAAVRPAVMPATPTTPDPVREATGRRGPPPS